MRRTRTALCLALVTGAGLFASTHQRLDSRWRDRDITIDGDNGDWPGPLRPIEENRPILAAAANDGQFLYLVPATSPCGARSCVKGSRSGLIPRVATRSISASSFRSV